MSTRLKLFKPTPLTVIFLLFFLAAQGIFSPSTMTVTPGEPLKTEHPFGLGAPITTISVDGQTRLQVRWAVLLLNVACCYAISAIAATAMAKATRLRRVATSYGLVALAMIVLAWILSIVISKAYWGYFIARPPLLSEARQITHVRAIALVKTVEDSGQRRLMADTNSFLADRLAAAKKYSDDALGGRILLELDRKHLLPAELSESLPDVSDLYGLVQKSGLLAKSAAGYDSAGQLRGIVVDAIGGSGERLVLVALEGGQLSNDHYPYYELLFRDLRGANGLRFVRGQRFFYDASGLEGFEWYVIWPMLSIPAILVGFVIFTAIKTIPKKEEEKTQNPKLKSQENPN